MKILITGANGYLGQGIVEKMLDFGHSVMACDIKTDFIDPRAEKMDIDLFEVENPFVYFKKPDVLLHLAWRDGFMHYSDAHIEDLPKHYAFIKKMTESGTKKIVGLGSMHEIGFFEGCIEENTPCNPVTPYGISKNALRELTKQLTQKNEIQFQWLRGYYIVGNSHFGNSIFSKITIAEENGKTDFPFTLGQNQFDFIDYENFCTQIAASVGQNEVKGIINICSGRPEKLAERVDRFLKDNHYNIKLNYGAFPDRSYDSKAVWGDSSKIERILKFTNYKV